MVGISIDSGKFSFENKGDVRPPISDKSGLKVLVLGNFSGGNECELSDRVQYRIDKDNFDEVFQKLNVGLRLPSISEPIRFKEIDDLHPDHLFSNVALFERYQTLIRQLKSPNGFQQAVDSLVEEGLVSKPEPLVSEAIESEGLLASLLVNTSATTSESAIQRLIRQTVAPYVESKGSPKIEEYCKAVELAMSQLMRQLIHSSEFQSLETCWRSVDLLNRRLDTDKDCHLHIMDVTPAELIGDFESTSGDIAASAFNKVVFELNSVAGGRQFDVVIIDASLKSSQDLNVFEVISELAEATGTLVLTGAGVESLNNLSVDLDSWMDIRKNSGFNKSYIASPNFMVRRPYGQKTSPIESFHFEELPDTNKHSYYLWGNSAYLMLIALCAEQGGECVVDRLPIHTYTQDGESEVTPCSERYLCSREVTSLEGRGCTVIQSIKGRDAVLISSWQPFFKG